MSESMNVAELTFTIKDLLGPFTTKAEGLWEWPEKFNNLSDVVVVFAIFGARLRIEQIVPSDEFENLKCEKWVM